MKELQFIGTGSAFNTKLGNTSAFIRSNNSLLLIDCGGTVFHRLQELGFLNELKKIYIVLTHTHPDHVGSLGDLIFYSYHILKLKVTIFFPNKEVIKGLLSKLGVSDEFYEVNNLETVYVKDEYLGAFNVEFLSVSHVDTIPSYGFIMKLNEKLFYYSGDSNNISETIINKMRNNEISNIYQDTCGLDYNGNAHLSLKKLSEIIPQELRNKVYCMHLDEYISKKEIEANGFNIAEKFNTEFL
jgi:phosphoribosyl 1,2-cyclic phosphodiesterase